MKREGISRTQLMALLWAGVLAPAGELLPGLLLPLADKGAGWRPLWPPLWYWREGGC